MTFNNYESAKAYARATGGEVVYVGKDTWVVQPRCY